VSVLAAAVLVPLAGATLAVLVRSRLLGLVTAAATVATVGAAIVAVWEAGSRREALGGWGAPVGIELYADGLSALMLALTAAVGTAVTVYAAASSPEPTSPVRGPGGAFWPLWLTLWAALNALFLSRDLFNVYVALELTTIAAIGLVLLERRRVAIQAGTTYLLAALAGSLAYLLGVALVYGEAGTLSVDGAGATLEPSLASWTAVSLITVGLAVKAALFPLHFWLPGAHANAPAAVSAVLSALVVKGGFYLILRLWAEAFPQLVTPPPAALLGALGATAIVWGSLQAIRQRRLKLLVAYSTVAQLGYLFLVFPLLVGPAAGPWRDEAFSGAAYQALSHGFAKAAMFLAAGNVLKAFGSDEIQGLDGIAARLPLSTYAFGIAGISLMGVPPSGGFIAKWLILKAAIGSGQWWIAVVVVAGGFLAAGYLLVVIRHAFLPVREPSISVRLPRTLEVTPFVLALVSIGLGLRAQEALELLRRGTEPLLQMGLGG
jgi:multicomponent Na+:H+ antiporter subunit D